MLGRILKILIKICVYQLLMYESACTEEVYSLDLRPRIDYFSLLFTVSSVKVIGIFCFLINVICRELSGIGLLR